MQPGENIAQRGAVQIPASSLARRKWKQRQHGSAPSQRLADALHKAEVLRSREEPVTGRPVRIDGGFDIGEQLRSILNLVKDRRRRIVTEERDRVGQRADTHIGIFERQVPVARRPALSEQRGFS
jgi:hypothetical protein